MDRLSYIANTPVLSDDLNFITDSKNNQVRDRSQIFLGDSRELSYGLTTTTGSVFRGGVCANPLDYWKFWDNLSSFNLGLDWAFYVMPGKALTENGDLIVVPSPGVMVQWINTSVWDVSPNTVGYVKVQYQEASSSLDYDNYGNPHYLDYDRWFSVVANSDLPSSNEVLLATFLGDSVGKITSGTFQDRRSYATTVTPANFVLLNPYREPAQTLGWTTFEDHAHAYGTGTPSVINPHGLSFKDVGALSSTGSITYKTFSSISVGPTLAFNTIYQNTYGYTIGISAICLGTAWGTVGSSASPTAIMQFLVGSSSPPTIIADDFRCGLVLDAPAAYASASVSRNLFAIVPNGWYYKLYSSPMFYTAWEGSASKSISTVYYLTPP
jgi:hypothetical protein